MKITKARVNTSFSPIKLNSSRESNSCLPWKHEWTSEVLWHNEKNHYLIMSVTKLSSSKSLSFSVNDCPGSSDIYSPNSVLCAFKFMYCMCVDAHMHIHARSQRAQSAVPALLHSTVRWVSWAPLLQLLSGLNCVCLSPDIIKLPCL